MEQPTEVFNVQIPAHVQPGQYFVVNHLGQQYQILAPSPPSPDGVLQVRLPSANQQQQLAPPPPTQQQQMLAQQQLQQQLMIQAAGGQPPCVFATAAAVGGGGTPPAGPPLGIG